jgi:lysine-specific demethylase 3
MKAPRFGGAGALWDLYRREDIDVLRKFILDVVAGKVKKCPPFYYKNKKLTLEDIKDPVHDQAIMLTASHRAAAALPPYNLQSWLIEQYEHEGVVIPAACAHQVRNLRSCIKIALDFVSPESVPLCLAQREERRALAMAEVRERGGVLNSNEVIEDRHFHDKLQVVNMVVHGLTEALNVLDDGGGRTDKKARAANK